MPVMLPISCQAPNWTENRLRVPPWEGACHWQHHCLYTDHHCQDLAEMWAPGWTGFARASLVWRQSARVLPGSTYLENALVRSEPFGVWWRSEVVLAESFELMDNSLSNEKRNVKWHLAPRPFPQINCFHHTALFYDEEAGESRQASSSHNQSSFVLVSDYLSNQKLKSK